jgi:hypothetical protein
MDKSLTYFIFAKNENDLLIRTILSSLKAKPDGWHVDFLIIDDGSDVPISQTIFDRDGLKFGLELRRNNKTIGLSGSVYSYIHHVTTEYVVFIPGSDTFDGASVYQALNDLNPKYDLFLFQRINRLQERPMIKYLASLLIATSGSIKSKKLIYDFDGFNVYKTHLVQKYIRWNFGHALHLGLVTSIIKGGYDFTKGQISVKEGHKIQQKLRGKAQVPSINSIRDTLVTLLNGGEKNKFTS